MDIALDIDGVVADFATPCNGWLAACLGVERQPVDRWDWYRNYGTPDGDDAWRRFWGYAVDSEFFNCLPVIEGAQEGYRSLIRQGHHVVFVTARKPRDFGVATRKWLNRHQFHSAVHHVDDKSDLVDEFDLLIDDAPHHLEGWRNAGGQALVFAQPWNRELSSSPGVSSWSALARRLAYRA